MTPDTLVEIAATACGLAYIVFIIRENIICWPFGIVGSLLSVYLMLENRLYSEAILYVFYVLMGVWGWVHWARREAQADNPVQRYAARYHLVLVLGCSLATLALGGLFSTYTDAARPYIDAATTVFSFAATWLEIKKVLETWVYWIVLNAASVWLYADRSLDIYAGLIWVYTILSVWGLVQWTLSYRARALPGDS
ncbi:nicotinamide riboside transporter PnuC [Mangrovimicrobium sediminis]|uniref:nicotinamide riboside transporter PnuC n=1 Tax=Mangrovimicrobium sediminis TaxID=2562682 RepID=UPI001436C40D|nr:nicotinamide riboside transporter PnuC [Haliea sp. SAOS-164]